MYTTFYSSSDAQIFFINSDNTKSIKIDTTIAVAYNVNQTSTPIYDLGSREPKFFSTGNTVCNGLLMVAFTSEQYIKQCIKFIIAPQLKNNEVSNLTPITKLGIGKMSNKSFKDRALAPLNVPLEESILSIGSINTPFDIVIYLNNEQLTTVSDTKMIRLKGVKLVSDKMEINSSTDSFLNQGYSFLFKDVERR